MKTLRARADLLRKGDQVVHPWSGAWFTVRALIDSDRGSDHVFVELKPDARGQLGFHVARADHLLCRSRKDRKK